MKNISELCRLLCKDLQYLQVRLLCKNLQHAVSVDMKNMPDLRRHSESSLLYKDVLNMERNAKNTTFYEFLKENAEKYSDDIAVLYDTFAVSYKRLYEDVVNKAIHLRRFEGKRIAIYGPASYRWIVNMFGSILAGKDIMLVDFFLPHDVRVKLLKKVGVDYILCSTNQYILSDSEAYIIENAEKDEVDGLEYDTSVKEGNVLMFTATATECDKAVVLKVEDILKTINNINKYCSCTKSDRVLAQLPLNHIFGYIYTLIWPLANGACVCVGRGLRHMDADTYYYGPTILPGNPSMIEYLKKIKAFNAELKTVIIGGAECSYHLFEELKDRDLAVHIVYGTEETTGSIAINSEVDGTYELFEKDSVKLSADGELMVRGSCVMAGYDNDKAADLKIFENGYLHTGDYGHFNSEGRLVITKYNPNVLLLPTGEKICRAVTNRELNDLNGVAESYITLYDDKLTAVIVPVDKRTGYDKIKRIIDSYNERKGYRWEIQRIVLLLRALPKNPDGGIDEEGIEDLLENENKDLGQD